MNLIKYGYTPPCPLRGTFLEHFKINGHTCSVVRRLLLLFKTDHTDAVHIMGDSRETGGGREPAPQNAKVTEVRWSVTRYAFLRHLVGSM